MDYLDGDKEINRGLDVPQWFVPHINGYPMSELGEFCYKHDITIECRYDSLPDLITLYFRGRNILGNFGVTRTIEHKMVNKNNISSLEDTLIKTIKEDFDIREDEHFMVPPRNSGKYYKEIVNARYGVCNAKPEIKKVIFSGPCTIVLWSDGDKTIVRCGKDDTFDKEKGLAMAISKKMLGTNSSKSSYYDVFKKFIQEANVSPLFDLCIHKTINVGFGEQDVRPDFTYIDRIVEYATKEMTIEEIENKLGHKVKIVNKK